MLISNCRGGIYEDYSKEILSICPDIDYNCLYGINNPILLFE